MARRGSTVRFDDGIFEILEQWQKKEALPSIAALIESLTIRTLRGELVPVPEGIDTSAAKIDAKSKKDEQLEQVGKALKALADGQPLPRDVCVTELANALGVDAEVITKLWKRTNGNSKVH